MNVLDIYKLKAIGEQVFQVFWYWVALLSASNADNPKTKDQPQDFSTLF
jgi:hypothetical protein